MFGARPMRLKTRWLLLMVHGLLFLPVVVLMYVHAGSSGPAVSVAPFFASVLVGSWIAMFALLTSGTSLLTAAASMWIHEPLLQLAPQPGFLSLLAGFWSTLLAMANGLLTGLPIVAILHLMGMRAATCAAIVLCLACALVTNVALGLLAQSLAPFKKAGQRAATWLGFAYFAPIAIAIFAPASVGDWLWHPLVALVQHLLTGEPVAWLPVVASSLLLTVVVLGLAFGAQRVWMAAVGGIPLRDWAVHWQQFLASRARTHRRYVILALFMLVGAVASLIWQEEILVAIVLVYVPVFLTPVMMTPTPGYAHQVRLVILSPYGRQVVVGMHLRRSLLAAAASMSGALVLVVHAAFAPTRVATLLLVVPALASLSIASCLWFDPMAPLPTPKKRQTFSFRLLGVIVPYMFIGLIARFVGGAMQIGPAALNENPWVWLLLIGMGLALGGAAVGLDLLTLKRPR